MTEKAISIFFTILFMAFITAPSIIVVIDDSFDITILFGNAEEEESEKNTNLEILHISNSNNREDFLSSINELYLEYRFNYYSIPHLNLISPPPEYI